MEKRAVIKSFSIDFQWPTRDPFLFCAYHHDHYPEGDKNLGPNESLSGRNIGQDFTIKNGYRMYHGQSVPGFPVHPHRGFETITLVRKGFVDHADSLGAAGRYGQGDVQWMTAGQGIQHSEMFPLLNKKNKNNLELLQLWINLPKAKKMVPANFKMFWSEKIPKVYLNDAKVEIEIIAGDGFGVKATPPPPDSWASQADSDVVVWIIQMQEGAEFVIPTSLATNTRTLYFYSGNEVTLNEKSYPKMTAFDLDASQQLKVKNGNQQAKLLLLQGKPLNEPVVQHGPFVMNTEEEIYAAIADYQKTQFGGWPWERPDMIHGDEQARFAKHTNGTEERPGE